MKERTEELSREDVPNFPAPATQHDTGQRCQHLSKSDPEVCFPSLVSAGSLLVPQFLQLAGSWPVFGVRQDQNNTARGSASRNEISSETKLGG